MTARQDANHEVRFAGVNTQCPLDMAARASCAPHSVSVHRMVELLLKHVDEGAGFAHNPRERPDGAPTRRVAGGAFHEV